MLRKILRKMGLTVHRNPKGSDIVIFDKSRFVHFKKRDEFVKSYFEGLKLSDCEFSDNFYKQLRFYSLQQLLHNTLNNGLQGDIVECGCWKGHSSYLIATLLSKFNVDKSFYIFDSFEGGLSDKTEKDRNLTKLNESMCEIKKEKASFESSFDLVKTLLEDFTFAEVRKCWIPDRFSEIEEKRFCFVHVDVDLYEPTIESLKFFYPRLNAGGVIVVDDYGECHFSGATVAVDEFLKDKKFKIHYAAPFGSCFIIK